MSILLGHGAQLGAQLANLPKNQLDKLFALTDDFVARLRLDARSCCKSRYADQ